MKSLSETDKTMVFACISLSFCKFLVDEHMSRSDANKGMTSCGLRITMV